MYDLKERIKGMNIVRSTLKKNLTNLPLYSREDAINLIDKINEELEFFKKAYEDKKAKQMSLF